MINKQQAKFFIIIFVSIVMSSCQRNKESETDKIKIRETIIRKCLSALKKDGPGSKYIVSPKFNDFEFNSFIRKNYSNDTDVDASKAITLKSLSWSDKKFLKTQTVVNKKYSGQFDYSLIKFSNTKISNFVITFSGINENLVFAEITGYCNALEASDLNKDFFSKPHRFSDVSCISFVIKNDKVEIINGNGITLEYQCNDSDKQIINY